MAHSNVTGLDCCSSERVGKEGRKDESRKGRMGVGKRRRVGRLVGR